MDFGEKMDAMRMNLELAIHDIEAQRADMATLRASIRELRDASAHQHETAQVLMKATESLLAAVQNHEGRIQGLERRA